MSKIFSLNVDVYQIFFDFNANFDATSNNKFDSNKDVNNKTSIDATTITKISLYIKNKIIANEIVSRRERRLLDKRFKTIQEAKRKINKK